MTTRGTAFHEAGHAVVGLHLGLPVEGASILPNPHERYTGIVRFMPGFDGGTVTRRWLVGLVAGPVAQSMATGEPLRIETGKDSDGQLIEQALEQAGCLSQAGLDHIVADARALLAQPALWKSVELIASQLLEVGRLDGATLQALLDSR